jgi:hypothetical protein
VYRSNMKSLGLVPQLNHRLVSAPVPTFEVDG